MLKKNNHVIFDNYSKCTNNYTVDYNVVAKQT